MNSKHISLKGRVFGRDFIYRKRVSKSLLMFYSGPEMPCFLSIAK